MGKSINNIHGRVWTNPVASMDQVCVHSTDTYNSKWPSGEKCKLTIDEAVCCAKN